MKVGFWLWHSIFMTLTYCMFWRVWKPTDDWLLLHKRSGDTLMIHSATLPGTTFSIPFDQLVGCVVCFVTSGGRVAFNCFSGFVMLRNQAGAHSNKCPHRSYVFAPTKLKQPKEHKWNVLRCGMSCPNVFQLEYVRVKRAQFRHATSVCKDVSCTWAGVCTGGLNDCMRYAWGKHLDRLQNTTRNSTILPHVAVQN